MSNEIVVGLDIGTTKIACIVGQAADNGKIKILGFGKCKSIGVERGVVKNVIDTSDSIRKAVDEASEMSGFDITEVYVGIAGQHISSMQNKGSIVLNPPHKIIDEEDINRLINATTGKVSDSAITLARELLELEQKHIDKLKKWL